jgi:hypothetical protein
MINEILMVLTTVALLGVSIQSIALLRVKRSHKHAVEILQDAQQRVKHMEQELGALCSAAVGAGDHVVKLEQKVKRIIERQNLFELRASSDRPYSQASQLVHRGADIEELVDSCGLTRGEAELLVMMQRGTAGTA